MKRDSTKIDIDETYSTPPTTYYESNKTIIRSNNDTWSSDIKDMNDCGASCNKRYRNSLVVTDILNEIGWTNPLEKKDAQTTTDAFSEKKIKHQHVNLISSKQMMVKYINRIFNNFLQQNFSKRYSRYTSRTTAFAE